MTRGLDDFLRRANDTEFDVETGDFGVLEIRQGDPPEFHYFYDTKARRLITTFVLRRGQRVDTLCDVVLIKKDDGYTPRLSFWKRDKARGEMKDELTEEASVSEGRTILIKSRVDVRDSHENFWKLIRFLQAYRDVVLPAEEFRVTSGEDAVLLDAMEGRDKAAVLAAVKTYLRGEVTEQDVELLLDRRRALDTFARLLSEPEFFEAERNRLGVTVEGVWQRFFEANTWIFGYGLTLVACESYTDDGLEQMTTGRDIFSGAGKRGDALMKTKGFLQTLLFAEIKRHDTDLLRANPYREPDVYQPSRELSGAVSQVQKTAHKAVRKMQDLHRHIDPDGQYRFEVSTIRPRQVVVAGRLEQLADDDDINTEKMSSLELWRRGQLGVEIVTFDELYERAKYIVENPTDQSPG